MGAPLVCAYLWACVSVCLQLHVCACVCVCAHMCIYGLYASHTCAHVYLSCVCTYVNVHLHVCPLLSLQHIPVHIRRTPEIQEVTGERTRSQGQGPLGLHKCWGQRHSPGAESLQTHQPKVARLMLSRSMAKQVRGSLSRTV